jgi:ATPase subunit of ABC transporter with duplicated ATPase domains
MVMVSHSTNTLRDYCQAGLVLHEGQLHYYPDIEDAIEHHDSNMGEPGEDDADRGKEARKRKKQQERKQRRSPEEKEQLVAERQAARQLKREKKAAEKQAAQQQQELAAQAQLYPQQSIDMGPPPLPATRNDQN